MKQAYYFDLLFIYHVESLQVSARCFRYVVLITTVLLCAIEHPIQVFKPFFHIVRFLKWGLLLSKAKCFRPRHPYRRSQLLDHFVSISAYFHILIIDHVTYCSTGCHANDSDFCLS